MSRSSLPENLEDLKNAIDALAADIAHLQESLTRMKLDHPVSANIIEEFSISLWELTARFNAHKTIVIEEAKVASLSLYTARYLWALKEFETIKQNVVGFSHSKFMHYQGLYDVLREEKNRWETEMTRLLDRVPLVDSADIHYQDAVNCTYELLGDVSFTLNALHSMNLRNTAEPVFSAKYQKMFRQMGVLRHFMQQSMNEMRKFEPQQQQPSGGVAVCVQHRQAPQPNACSGPVLFSGAGVAMLSQERVDGSMRPSPN